MPPKALKGKAKRLLEYCNEHLEKVIDEAKNAILQKYGQDRVHRIKKWVRLGRFSLRQDSILGLIQSVEHAKSLLQTALLGAILYRDEFKLQKLQDDIQNMSQKSLQGHQNIGNGMKDALHEHTKRLENYLFQQKEEVQKSLKQYRNELGMHSKNFEESHVINHDKLMQKESDGSNVLGWPLFSLPEKSSKHCEEMVPDPRLLIHSTHDVSLVDHALWLSRDDEPIETPEEHTSIVEGTSEVLCMVSPTASHACNPENNLDIIASGEDHDLNSFNGAFANLISESYFDISDISDPSDTATDAFEIEQAYISDNTSRYESDDASGYISDDTSGYISDEVSEDDHSSQPLWPKLKFPIEMRIDMSQLHNKCIMKRTQRLRFCIRKISRAAMDNIDGKYKEEKLRFQDPCLPLDSCKHVSVELPMEEFRNFQALPTYVRLYCRDGTNEPIIGESVGLGCSHDHTIYRSSMDTVVSVGYVLQNRRLAGHLIWSYQRFSMPDVRSSTSDM
ncbi:hypothetical protein BKA66DRAFT_437653 [Pyrenochaeta sp. MPI-SDFR-AT-0127]|nr:hypothetical protein BKA66DRAFT_437653 [Pyrenochaeta sp. MPI-SDFR-AT-0127]